MSALRVGLGARIKHRRLTAQVKRWWELVTLTSSAAINLSAYPAEQDPSPLFRTAANNCFTFAGAMACTAHDLELRAPDGIEAPRSLGELLEHLDREGWERGAPEVPTPNCHLVLVCSGAAGTDPNGNVVRDFHFYRLGPSGWAHKPGDAAAEQVQDPVRDALRRGYREFGGLWTVWHDPARNQARTRFAEAEHQPCARTGEAVPMDRITQRPRLSVGGVAASGARWRRAAGNRSTPPHHLGRLAPSPPGWSARPDRRAQPQELPGDTGLLPGCQTSS